MDGLDGSFHSQAQLIYNFIKSRLCVGLFKQPAQT